MHLGTAYAGREPRPTGTALIQPNTRGINEIGGLGELAAQAAMGLLHQSRQQLGKHRHRPPGVGIRQGRAPNRTCTQMIEPRRMALQSRHNLAQARCPRELAVEQRDKLTFRRQPTNPRSCSMRRHQPVKLAPRQVLQNSMKNAILMAHGIDPPSRVRIVGETSRTEWNQCHVPCLAKLNRTAVDQVRP
jgi:hypothetical protein